VLLALVAVAAGRPTRMLAQEQSGGATDLHAGLPGFEVPNLLPNLNLENIHTQIHAFPDCVSQCAFGAARPPDALGAAPPVRAPAAAWPACGGGGAPLGLRGVAALRLHSTVYSSV